MSINEQAIAKAWDNLETAKINWRLADDGEVVKTHSSLLQPVIYHGKQAMLKTPFSDEERRGCLLMTCYEGNGAAAVWEYDGDSMVMERACGPGSLKQMVLDGNEDEANGIICAVTAKLHTVKCIHNDAFIPLTDWFRSLRLAAAIHGGALAKCNAAANKLLADPQDQVILHGDIHHENILDSGTRGWIAIDPKGLIGERGFDYANIFCNPDDKTATSPARLSRQVAVISKAAELDPKRLLNWIIAWSGLSAAFGLEDGEDPTTPLIVAQIAEKALGKY
jgi:streptomycin 6-kinase